MCGPCRSNLQALYVEQEASLNGVWWSDPDGVWWSDCLNPLLLFASCGGDEGYEWPSRAAKRWPHAVERPGLGVYGRERELSDRRRA